MTFLFLQNQSHQAARKKFGSLAVCNYKDEKAAALGVITAWEKLPVRLSSQLAHIYDCLKKQGNEASVTPLAPKRRYIQNTY